MRLERTKNRKVTISNSAGNLAFIDWQVSNIARVVSLDLDATAKQEMIKTIVDWPYVGIEPFPSLH